MTWVAEHWAALLLTAYVGLPIVWRLVQPFISELCLLLGDAWCDCPECCERPEDQ